jgi:hypothetical protein
MWRVVVGDDDDNESLLVRLMDDDVSDLVHVQRVEHLGRRQAVGDLARIRLVRAQDFFLGDAGLEPSPDPFVLLLHLPFEVAADRHLAACILGEHRALRICGGRTHRSLVVDDVVTGIME